MVTFIELVRIEAKMLHGPETCFPVPTVGEQYAANVEKQGFDGEWREKHKH
jgi:hypothetical protein